MQLDAIYTNSTFTYMFTPTLRLFTCLHQRPLSIGSNGMQFTQTLRLLTCLHQLYVYLHVYTNSTFTYMFTPTLRLLTCLHQLYVYLHVYTDDLYQMDAIGSV